MSSHQHTALIVHTAEVRSAGSSCLLQGTGVDHVENLLSFDSATFKACMHCSIYGFWLEATCEVAHGTLCNQVGSSMSHCRRRGRLYSQLTCDTYMKQNYANSCVQDQRMLRFCSMENCSIYLCSGDHKNKERCLCDSQTLSWHVFLACPVGTIFLAVVMVACTLTAHLLRTC